MTLGGLASFFLIMLALAAVPSASVALVVTRSATHGFLNGAAVALGIVLADLLLAALAIFGLSLLAEVVGGFFAVFKYLGGAYLIWTGIRLLRSKPGLRVAQPGRASYGVSLVSGFLLTLGDLKAILFYASLFPLFIDLQKVTALDLLTIGAVTVVTVGGVKVVYAALAESLVSRLRQVKVQRRSRQAAGGLLIGTGTYLIAKG